MEKEKVEVIDFLIISNQINNIIIIFRCDKILNFLAIFKNLPLEVVVAGCGAEGSPSPATECAATHASYVAPSDNDLSSVDPPSPTEGSLSSNCTVVV